MLVSSAWQHTCMPQGDTASRAGQEQQQNGCPSGSRHHMLAPGLKPAKVLVQSASGMQPVTAGSDTRQPCDIGPRLCCSWLKSSLWPCCAQTLPMLPIFCELML